MDIPDILYRLTEADRQTYSFAAAYLRTISAAVAAASVQATLTNDLNRIIDLRNLAGWASPGAAQGITALEFQLVPPSGTTLHYIKGDETDWGVGVRAWLNWTGSVFVPPLWKIQFNLNFSGAVANTYILTAFGIVIPVGTLVPT